MAGRGATRRLLPYVAVVGDDDGGAGSPGLRLVWGGLHLPQRPTSPTYMPVILEMVHLIMGVTLALPSRECQLDRVTVHG